MLFFKSVLFCSLILTVRTPENVPWTGAFILAEYCAMLYSIREDVGNFKRYYNITLLRRLSPFRISSRVGHVCGMLTGGGGGGRHVSLLNLVVGSSKITARSKAEGHPLLRSD